MVLFYLTINMLTNILMLFTGISDFSTIVPFLRYFSLSSHGFYKHTERMLNKTQKIYTSNNCGTIKEMALSVLRQIDSCETVLKITFFHLPHDNVEYLSNNAILRNVTKEHFGNRNTPLVSYIAQKPLQNILTAEVTFLSEEDVTLTRQDKYTILQKGDTKELITEGIIPQDINTSTYAQASNIFDTISCILSENGFNVNDIYRQWNYIEGITTLNDGRQNYQDFNDARSIFYSQASWMNGYPAATGIGTGRGGVMIEIYAQNGNGINMPIDNPMQISAHNYSQNVLAGKTTKELSQKTTPKFERARITESTIYISGTAAIKGEESLPTNETTAQAAATMEIMDCLISKENIPVKSNGSIYDTLRIYVKHEADINNVQCFMNQHYPIPEKLYLVCDICRPELLIEIEGTAHTKQ